MRVWHVVWIYNNVVKHTLKMKYTLTQLRKDYPNDEACLDKIFQIRFANLKCCPQCQSETKFHRVMKRMCYECQHCGYQIFPLAGTPLEKTRTNLTKWFHAIHMMTTTRNGVAAKEIERVLGVTYKCAWRMMHQIRKVMAEGGVGMLSGCIQSDETLIGGVEKGSNKRGFGSEKKSTVFGMVEEGGKVIMKKVEDRKRKTLLPIIEKYVDKGAHITTDELPSYKVIGVNGYTHSTVNHNKEEYVNEQGKHTNTIEGVWSILKRSISSTHVWVSDTHLPKYLNEFEFRYNNRGSAAPMFNTILSHLSMPLCRVDKETGEVITVYQEQRA